MTQNLHGITVRLGWGPRLLRIAGILTGLILLAIFVETRDRKQDRTRGDLSNYSLAASHVLIDGGNPYSRDEVGRNYKYLPTNAILLIPLTLVDKYRAQGIWFALNVGLLIWCIVLHHRLFAPLRIPRWVTWISVIFCLRLFTQNIRLGQWNTSVYCLAFIGLYYLHRQASVRGAAALALGAVLKFTPAGFLIMFLLQRQWKLVGLIVAAILAWMIVPPVATVGSTKTIEILDTFKNRSMNTYRKLRTGENVSSVSMRSTVFRYLTPAHITLDNRQTYRVNVVDLDPLVASRWALAGCLLFFAGTAYLTVRHASRPPTNGLHYLALVGHWFTLMMMCSPGLREAQMIAVFTPVFAAAAATALSPLPRKLWMITGLILAGVAINSISEVRDGTVYHELLQAVGILAVAQVLLWFQTAYILQQSDFTATSPESPITAG